MKAHFPDWVQRRISEEGIGWMRGKKIEVRLRRLHKVDSVECELRIRGENGKVMYRTDRFAAQVPGTIRILDLDQAFKVST